MNNMQFAIINKIHFIIMFVKRHKSRVKPGQKNNQVYVPHQQRSLHTDYPPITSQMMANYYYNQLLRFGYIEPPTPPTPPTGNVFLSKVTTMPSCKMVVENDGSLSFDGTVDTTAINPLPPIGQNYKIYFFYGKNISFAKNGSNFYYNESPQIKYLQNNYYNQDFTNTASTKKLKLDFALSFYKVVTDDSAVYFYVATDDEHAYLIPTACYFDLTDSEFELTVVFVKQ